MTSVSVSQNYKTVIISEGAGQTTIVSAPNPAVIIEAVGIGPQGPQGGDGTIGSHASIIDTTDQPVISTSASQVITYNTLLSSNNISVQNNNRITFQLNGVYKILVSLQVTNSGNNLTEVDFFFRKNGLDIPNSNTRIDMQPRKSISTPYHYCFTAEMQLNIVGGDYVQVFWSSENLGVSLDTIPGDALHPQSPSIIINVAQVMFGQLSAGASTVASLPSASAVGAGVRYFVTDATSTTFLSVVAGGGSNGVPVVSNGINWIIG